MPDSPHSAVHPYHKSTIKRVFDVVMGSALLLLALPVITIAATWVWLRHGEPVFFRQKRRGKHQRVFTMVKIRTMVKNAEQLKKKLLHKNQAPSPMFKIFNDPRFIQGGTFLSATGIDELPQLINVIRGEMSLVGPRPLPVQEAAKLPKNWRFRFEAKPGLFSHWSANTDRHKSLKHWRSLELQTLTQGGIFSDLTMIARITLSTLHSVLRYLFHPRT